MEKRTDKRGMAWGKKNGTRGKNKVNFYFLKGSEATV